MTTFFPKPLDKQVAALSDSLSQTQDGLAIVANGNTHAAISSGQFVYVKNHDTLAEGLYKATGAIGVNVALTTSNLTSDGTGGLNDLQGQVTALNSKFVISEDTPKPYITIRKENNIASVSINGMYRTNTTVSNGYRPTAPISIICTGYQNGFYFPVTLTIQTNGNVICRSHYNWGSAEVPDNAISLNGSSAYIIG